ncbi:CHASE2 domain-containing protein [Neosynechococcus sphagnicola]|uniref:CHASE2 domain-containing protein n=1 Tax=Neosynechococcus sphagnicola TaxID=1501145 RepID=UPI000A763896|nr:adenylate/guanylate cyclase domain-containing protein [Neosynechococcus sphagnicola]
MSFKFISGWRRHWSAARLDVRSGRLEKSELLVIAITAVVVSGVLLGMRQLGWLQPMELLAYDQMVRLRHDRGPDPRLLVVGITEDDINHFAKRWPLPDQVLADAIARIQLHQPRAIGLDIWRNVPNEPGHQALLRQFQAPNVFVITKIGDVPPPPSFLQAKNQIGSNDVAIDPDGVLRRNLLFPSTNDPVYLPFSEDGVFYALSLRLALAYLAVEGIYPQASPTNPNYLKLGRAVFVPLRYHAGGYQNIDAARNDQDVRGYQSLINYGSRNPAPQVSLRALLEGKVSPDLIQNKIVLVGAVALSTKDLFLTPYSAGDTSKNAVMPGVMIHAQAISQILDAAHGQQTLFWFWPEWAEVVWIIGWTLMGGGLAWLIQHPMSLGLSGVLMLGVLLGITFSIFTQDGWIPLAAPGLGVVMMGIALVTYRAYQAQQQQQIVMTLLGQNASPAIAAALWHDRDKLLKSGKLPGQKLTASILFTDVVGFSTISEQVSPEFLLEWLNEYLAMLTREVLTHHGIINKFTGDGIMAVFGVPVARTTAAEIANDAIEAVHCALAMERRLQELNQIWQTQGRTAIKMRVGIYTGPVVVGSLGSKDRLEYGVIGDSVNIASRLESCQKERQVGICRVLIAEETLVHLQEQFCVEPWGLMELKGKQQMVNVYRVVAVQENSLTPKNSEESSSPLQA